MAAHSLESASTYLNNLLLARGLLKNGKAIDFARADSACRGAESDPAKIINLVHDMVLRRDRDAEQRENLATNFRVLRADEIQRGLEIQRLQSRNEDLTRNMALMEAQDRALKASVRRAEAQVRELKEHMLKMKSTLDQVRAKCISDVRKRDMELEKLKGHLTGLQRGKRDASGMKVNTLNPQPAMLGAREMRGGQDVNSADWSLENETNDFLAALVNETSIENVSLRKIVGAATTELKHLTSLDQEPESNVPADDGDGIGVPGQYRKSRQKGDAGQQEVLVPCDKLATEMDAVLDHCRTILKDPSFVSIEEVQIREDEIIKLREGWEKMANKWKEAVVMMDTWRRRMLDGGDSVNLDELSHIGLTKSMAVLPNGEAVIGKDEDLSTAMFDDEEEIDLAYGEDVGSGNALFDRISGSDVCSIDIDDAPGLDMLPEPSSKRLTASPARRGLKLPRPVAALGQASGNAGVLPSHAGQTTSFTDSADSGIGSLDGSVEAEADDASLEHPTKPPSRIPRQVNSRSDDRLSILHNSDEAKKERTPPMTVFEKLAAVETEAKEAEEARQREERPHKRKASKPLLRGKARRRSTLLPEELANLMGAR